MAKKSDSKKTETNKEVYIYVSDNNNKMKFYH